MTKRPRKRNKLELMQWCFTQVGKGPDGYDELATKRLYIENLPPIDIDKINDMRWTHDLRQLGVKGTTAPKKMHYGFFVNGEWHDEDPNRIVKNNRGGLVPYLEAKPQDIYDEDDREQENAVNVAAAAAKSREKRRVIAEWERQKRADGWRDEDITMAAFHQEFPIEKENNEQGKVA
jgi:hypothetical protein